MAKIGLAQANTLRSNNTGETGYGIVYADEVSGHRTVKNLAALYALHDWQLSASGTNAENDALGQLWYVVDADGDGNGNLYQLKDWSGRKSASGWQAFNGGKDVDLSGYAKTEAVAEELAKKADKTEVEQTYVKSADFVALSETEIDDIWKES